MYLATDLQIQVSYFVPLSSYKPDKHDDMNEAIDFLKLRNYSVININNMIPVPTSEITYVNFKDEPDLKYKDLLGSEYRLIKAREQEILRNSRIVYNYRMDNKNKEKSLYKRCCDFKKLEEACVLYPVKLEVANTEEIIK